MIIKKKYEYAQSYSALVSRIQERNYTKTDVLMLSKNNSVMWSVKKNKWKRCPYYSRFNEVVN
jgi:hypothetical protein